MKFNARKFSTKFIDAKIKRGIPSLRKISEETGVSAATLSRIQNGGTPDIDSFAAICQWMGCKTNKFFHYPPKDY